jgi:hypothetical protein
MKIINDWWNRYVPKRDRPQQGMQGHVYRNLPKAKVCKADCVCYVCRDAALIKRLPAAHRQVT